MNTGKKHDSRLVSETAENLRNLILQQEPETCLGSLAEVASSLGVGIVTLQQTARILEHEGLLKVRRGPGGGYYGARPDGAALQRTFATYMRVHNISYRDAFHMTVSLDCDIAESAAATQHPELNTAIATLIEELEACNSAAERIEFEINFRSTLLRLVNNPLLELLSQVAMQLYKADSDPNLFADQIPLQDWQAGRMRVLSAIANRDAELAFFEARRFRRQVHEWSER